MVAKKRLLAGLASLTVMGIALAGCGSSTNNSSNTPKDEKVTITYMHRLPDNKGMTLVNDIVAKWNKDNPNIQVKATKFDGAAQDMIKKLATDVKAGAAPDLAQVGYAELPEVFNQGLLQDVTEEAAKYKDHFAEGPFSMMQIGGKAYGLPQDTGPLTYFYNAKEFEKLGITVPKTADELIATAKKTAAQGKYIMTFQPDEGMMTMSGTSGKFWTGVGHVLLYTVIQVPIMIIAALALAMVIDSFVVKHVTGFRLGYFLPYAIPGVVASIIWVYLYNGQISPIVKGLESIGIHVDFFANNVVLGSMANITTWTFTGYNMLIFLAALQAIPHDLYEAARIDGANGFQVAMKIKLPNVRGAALLAMLLSIVGTIQLFNEPQIMSTADPGISKAYTPMMMAMNTSQGTLTPSGDGPASAIAIVMALIAGLLAVVYTLAERKVNE